jgi:23S rRNA pseudouridine1911/1915/1917 synthase
MQGSEWIVAANDAGMRLDRFLAEESRLGSRSRAAAAIARGKIFVNGGEATPDWAARRLAAGDSVRLWMDRPGSAQRRSARAGDGASLQIVYRDAVLVVVNKPAGLLTVPLPRRDAAPSVESELATFLRAHGKRRPLVVHRIDRDTSGLVLFATRSDAQARLKAQFLRHEPERVYLAVVYGCPSPSQGTWRDWLAWDQDALVQKQTHPADPRAKEARSDYRVIEDFGVASLIEVRLITGKRNQIRLQARLRGHTLVGEQRYTFGPEALRSLDFPRQALHAARLAFRHPVSGERLQFEAPLPADMAELVARLRSREPTGHAEESNE